MQKRINKQTFLKNAQRVRESFEEEELEVKYPLLMKRIKELEKRIEKVEHSTINSELQPKLRER